MKVWSKVRSHKDGKIIKEYKFIGITLLQKETTTTDRYYKILGFKISKKRNHNTPLFIWPTLPNATHISSRKVAIIATLDIPQCTLYRITNKINVLKELGYQVEVARWEDQLQCFKILQLADFVIFYRVPFLEEIKKYYNEATRLGIKKIYDIDDLIFDSNLYGEFVNTQPLPPQTKKHLIDDSFLYAAALQHADQLWASTSGIAQAAKKLIPNIKIVPNCIPLSITKVIPQKQGDKIKIFYGSGTQTHDKDFEICAKILNKTLLKYKDVELYIHGYLNTQSFSKQVQSKIHHIDFVQAEDYYFSISSYDIAVAPLAKNIFSMAKSNIKYIEASMLEIPCVVSNLPEFANVINNGQTGFVAQTEKDWETALNALIESKKLRDDIAKRAKQNVLRLYSHEANKRYIQQALGQQQLLPKPSKKKVLFVNVLYGHSSFGGATIVAEELAKIFNSCYRDWQSSVFTCHTGKPENILTRYNWQGVPVFSVSINSVNLNFENKDIVDNFNKVLDAVQPDIVHFHCIQTMGIDIMKVVQKKKIPYTITMHDAWFVCARQFFLDVNNKYCDQHMVCAEECQTRCGISNKDFFHRRNKMFQVLNGASWICTPSQTFSQQLQANFPLFKLGVNTNGISFAGIKPKKKTYTNDIVFGFFGGKDEVKGYFFMRNILNKRIEKNWKLILIDTGRKFGHTSITKQEWDNTKVEILDYVPHEKMADIFQRIDVLLFPSQWNESFGLMVREAIANNVFVLCSECGGPRSAIVNGKNGLVFPKNDANAFNKCLDFIFEHQQQIKKYKTTEFGDIRTFKAQADELKQKFDSILRTV